MRTADFFAFARARHLIYLYRLNGRPEPWTEDPILGTYRFTNVFRELDRVTLWIREHVRDKLHDRSPWMQVLAVILARTFNRTETLEQIFCQERLGHSLPIAWSFLSETYELACRPSDLLSYMRANCQPPWVTGAYIVKTPDGMDKLEGALWIVEQAARRLPDLARDGSFACSMEALHADLVRFPYLGGFTAYEVVSDVRWTEVGRNWPDIMSWAHAGPGAVRGLNRIHGRPVKQGLNQRQALAEMRDLLAASRDTDNWPQYVPGTTIVNFTPTRPEHCFPSAMPTGDWPGWEMREVEHTLCEFDKYERVRLGEGTPRGRFR